MQHKKIRNIDALNLFLKLKNSEKNISFIHSKHKNGWDNLIAFNPDNVLKIDNKNAKKQILDFTKKNENNLIIGYFSYDFGRSQHQVKRKTINDINLPEVYLLAYSNFIKINHIEAKIYYQNKNYLKQLEQIIKRDPINDNKKEKINFKSCITKEEYNKAYKKIKKYIKTGDIYQINLTHRLEAKTNLDPKILFSKICKKNNVEHLAFIQGDNFEILSASPERFIKIKNRKITTAPVKGTRPRDKDPQIDIQNMIDLEKSPKEKAELNMITDLLRNDIGKIAKIGSVKVEKHRIIQKCPKVWHTYSLISGIIQKGITPIESLISMLPGGSITGCPKKRAIEIIEDLEKYSRGVYTGAIGFIMPEQKMLDFNIAIRTVIKKKNKVHLQVGGGIVLDSNQKDEFQETLDKAKSFTNLS